MMIIIVWCCDHCIIVAWPILNVCKKQWFWIETNGICRALNDNRHILSRGNEDKWGASYVDESSYDSFDYIADV